jgi:REP element-mobilizing transposase RayT
MPQSFACLHYHFVFSTKGRAPLLAADWQPRLFEYMGGTLRTMSGCLVAAGGTDDHVHLLARLGRETAVAEAMRLLKSNSSKWIHETFPSFASFAWQAGYGAFTVSFSQLGVVKAYIAKQEEHHRVQTFQDEFRELLRKHEIEFDERYIWD